MAHPLESTIREAYVAFGRGDIDGYLRACAENFTFEVPGHGGIAGTYAGRQGIYDLGGKAMELTSGTFQEEVEDAANSAIKQSGGDLLWEWRPYLCSSYWFHGQDPQSLATAFPQRLSAAQAQHITRRKEPLFARGNSVTVERLAYD